MIDFSHDILKVAYTDANKTHVEITMGNPEDKKLYVHFLPCTEENPDWQDLLTRVSIDQIEEMTKTHFEGLQKIHEEELVDFAKKNGLIYDPAQYTPNSKLNIDYIFNLPETEVGIDFLFELKLRVFDIEQIVQSDNQEWKKKIRDSNSPIEVMYWAGKFLYE